MMRLGPRGNFPPMKSEIASYCAHTLDWASRSRLASANLSFQFNLPPPPNTHSPTHLFPKASAHTCEPFHITELASLARSSPSKPTESEVHPPLMNVRAN